MAQELAGSPETIVDPRLATPGAGTAGTFKPSALQRITAWAEGSGVGNLRDVKEQYASRIALMITWTFTISALLILAGVYAILRRAPADAEALLVRAGIPALKEAGSFLSGVFGPLLAFVLGYYFGERKSRS